MPVLTATTKLYPVNQFGLGGLNTFDDPADIQDNELANVRNMVLSDGVLQNRKGSLLHLAKPAGETQTQSQLLVATNSIGVDYMIAVYGSNFYLADEANHQWIKINTVYSPASVGIFYGSTNWNAGLTNDVFYFGNGVDDTMKWNMSFGTIKVATLASDTTLVVNTNGSFPATGKLILMNGGTPIFLDYTKVSGVYTASTISFAGGNSISDSANGFVTAGFNIGDTIVISASINNTRQFKITNVTAGTLTVLQNTIAETAGASISINTIGTKTFTLTGTVSAIVPVGSSLTTPIIDATSVPVASVFTKAFGRLFVANSVGAENTLHYSVAGSPENFTYSNGLSFSTGINSGGYYTLYKGKGGILGMTDYGQYLLIEKVDVLSQFVFNIASDNSGFTVEVFPVISGDGIGPVNKAQILNYMNILYYPTSEEGIVSFSPTQTGVSTTSGLNLLSSSINNLVIEKFDFTLSRTCGLSQKLYWLVSLPTIGTPTTVNNLVLMYDLVRAQQNPSKTAWTIFDNWNAVDIKPVNGVLYYLSNSDGAVYQAYQGYQDAVLGQPLPYTSLAVSKRFNLNSPATLMRGQYMYLEGFVSSSTKLYIKVLDNENGSLGSQGYTIDGANKTLASGSFIAGLGAFELASPLLGGVDLATLQQLQGPLFFRVYLELSQAYREHNIQLELFSVDLGAQWGVSHITLISQPENSVETALVLGPSTVPLLTS